MGAAVMLIISWLDIKALCTDACNGLKNISTTSALCHTERRLSEACRATKTFTVDNWSRVGGIWCQLCYGC